MPKHLNDVWIHIVFSTKNKQNFLSESIRPHLCHFINKELIKLKCYVEVLNAQADHVHICSRINIRYSIPYIVKQIKGSSSRWLKNYPELADFEWQRGYAVYSVNGTHHERLTNYILNQDIIHAKRRKEKEG